MTCCTASGSPGSIGASTPRAASANRTSPPAAATPIPSRSSAANHSCAAVGGSPTSANRVPIGARSDSVSLTSKTYTAMAVSVPARVGPVSG